MAGARSIPCTSDHGLTFSSARFVHSSESCDLDITVTFDMAFSAGVIVVHGRHLHRVTSGVRGPCDRLARWGRRARWHGRRSAVPRGALGVGEIRNM